MKNPLYPKGTREIKPTRKHRPAIWESVLGTVYAYNGKDPVQYFDYDWDSAHRYAGVSPDRDPRVFKITRSMKYVRYPGSVTPPTGQLILWILK